MPPYYSKLTTSEDHKILSEFHDLHVFWGTKDYEEDYIGVLMERESSRMHFHYQSPQISERPKLVDWMRGIAAKKGLDYFTIHLAIYLLDVFMDNHEIIAPKLQLTALVCLLLATKFEERDCNVLKLTEMNELANNRYEIKDFNILEILILKHLEWNLLIPTAVHFVHINIEFLFIDDNFSDISFKTESEVWIETRILIKNYLDYIMEDVQLMHQKPSKVGAAIMAVTRIALGFMKIWPQKLHSITGYKLFELKPLISRLKQISNKKIE